MLWEFKNNKMTSGTAKKISSVYGQGVLSMTAKSETSFQSVFFLFSFLFYLPLHKSKMQQSQFLSGI